MKKLLLTVMALMMLLNCSVSAKETYKVEIITEQSNKKGFLAKTVYIKIKDFLLVVVEAATKNQVAKEVESYLNNYGLNKEKLAHKFNGKLKVALLEAFSPHKYEYNKFENVSLNYTLRQEAYTYLISVEKDEVCLLYPNTTAPSSLQNKGAYSLGGFAFDEREEVNFHLVSSLNIIDFSDFNPTGIYRCTKRGKGLQKIANIKNHYTNDVLRQDIFVK